jgi:uncharacterized protein YggE
MRRIVTILITLLTMSMNAQQQSLPSSISVTGEGIVKTLPDEAVLRVRTEHSGKEALPVKQKNDEVVNEVLKFCKSLKIESKHIQTERVNLGKNYDYQSKTYNYVANQSISITLKNLEKYEALLQGLLNSGINRIEGVDFKSSEADKLEAEARKKAMLNAKKKALDYATAIGQDVGHALHISEGGNAIPTPMPVYKAAAMSVQNTNSPARETIAAGELEIVVKVHVVFALKTS